MLEKVDLTLDLDKEAYKERLPVIGGHLTLLQRTCWEKGIPTIVVFEGWDASGKGSMINTILPFLDPRGVRVHALRAASKQDRQMPWLWRYWLRVPNYGEFAVFDRSWYGRVLVERIEKIASRREWQTAYQDILDFERALSEDGYTLIKFFLHISKKEQKRRFEKLEDDPLQKWRVTPEDWKNHRKYEKYLDLYEKMLETTNPEWAPWIIVEATDKYWTRMKILQTVHDLLQENLKKRAIELPAYHDSSISPKPAGEED